MKIRQLVFLLLLFFSIHKIFLWTEPFGSIDQNIRYSQQFLDRNDQLLRLTLANDDFYRVHTPLKEVSSFAIEATLLFEDRYFYYHPGINPLALLRAFWSTYILKTRILGASTITMQLARVLYGLNTRSLLGKLNQIQKALWLEFLYSKKDILAAYLNKAPYGFNIEGIGAASRIYFNKPARRLSLQESLTLAVIPQSPTKRTYGLKNEAQVNRDLKEARKLITSLWRKAYPKNNLDVSAMDLNLKMLPPGKLKFLAPHFVNSLSTAKHQVKTTLDLQVQIALEKRLASYIGSNKQSGVENASALLVDTRDMTVVSHIGSANFYDDKIQGQVDGVRSRRSPGSTLKPFVYGLAIQQGLIHPKTILKDAPTPFGTYTPDNFDRRFSGPLTATDALIHSRNIPAIALSRDLKSPTLYDFLKQVGIPLHEDPEHYGLSIVLGTAEVTMEELTTLYSSLNNKGLYRPLRRLLDAPINRAQKLLTPEAAFLTFEMLSQNPAPESIHRSPWQKEIQQVAWKTGTSVGFRDAWSIAAFDHYVLSVWVGNFNGSGNPAFLGRSAAGPLLFKLIETFKNIRKLDLRPRLPELHWNLSRVEVCAKSGHLPHKDCAHKTDSWFVPGVSPFSRCSVHRSIEMDPISGKQVCPAWTGPRVTRVFEYWPTDLLNLFKRAGIARKQPPSLHKICQGEHYGDRGPRILSPKKETLYQLRHQGSDSKEIPLLASADGDIRILSWYINNKKLGSSPVNKPILWQARSGNH